MEILNDVPVEILIYSLTIFVVLSLGIVLRHSDMTLRDIIHEIAEDITDKTIMDDKFITKVISEFIDYIEKRLEEDDKPSKGKEISLMILRTKFLNKILTTYVTKVVIPTFKPRKPKE